MVLNLVHLFVVQYNYFNTERIVIIHPTYNANIQTKECNTVVEPYMLKWNHHVVKTNNITINT